jgi:transcriptional regulator of acetoin/glycerol metabolism
VPLIFTRRRSRDLRELSRLEFEAGVEWSERAAGTNAIGTAIVDRRPLQTLGAEHFCEGSLGFTCTAAPVYRPRWRALSELRVPYPKEDPVKSRFIDRRLGSPYAYDS